MSAPSTILKFLPLCGTAPINKFKKEKSATLPRQNLMTWYRGATRKALLCLMLPRAQRDLGGKFWRDSYHSCVTYERKPDDTSDGYTHR